VDLESVHVPGLEAVAKNFKDKTGISVQVTVFNPDEVYRTKITTAASPPAPFAADPPHNPAEKTPQRRRVVFPLRPLCLCGVCFF
jgi:hypothetical protein